jgi:hypothetical protein
MRPSDIRRADGSALLAEVITRTMQVRGEEQSAQALRLVEPVVGPDGRFIEVELDTKLKPGERGQRHAEIGGNGQVQLTRHGLVLGFVFYYDMCMGNVVGVGPSLKHWKIWCMFRKMRFNGRVAPGYPFEKIVHPEVIHRRATIKRGVVHVSEEAVDREIEALLSSAEDLPEAERRRLVRVGQDAGMVADDVDIEELINAD